MMKLIKFRSSKVNPAHFVDKLGALISRSRGVKFIVNRANDVPELLGYILSERLAKCQMHHVSATTFHWTEKEIMKMKTENILQQPKAFHLKNKIAKIEANKIFSQ